MKLKDRLVPELNERVTNVWAKDAIYLPSLLEDWIEKDIDPIQLPVIVATTFFYEIYPNTRFDFIKYMAMWK